MKDKSRSTYNQKDKIRPILHLRINNLLDIRSPKSYAKAFLLQHTYEYKEVFFPFFLQLCVSHNAEDRRRTCLCARSAEVSESIDLDIWKLNVLTFSMHHYRSK